VPDFSETHREAIEVCAIDDAFKREVIAAFCALANSPMEDGDGQAFAYRLSLARKARLIAKEAIRK
jgi:hypothetical protein